MCERKIHVISNYRQWDVSVTPYIVLMSLILHSWKYCGQLYLADYLENVENRNWRISIWQLLAIINDIMQCSSHSLVVVQTCMGMGTIELWVL